MSLRSINLIIFIAAAIIAVSAITSIYTLSRDALRQDNLERIRGDLLELGYTVTKSIENHGAASSLNLLYKSIATHKEYEHVSVVENGIIVISTDRKRINTPYPIGVHLDNATTQIFSDEQTYYHEFYYFQQDNKKEMLLVVDLDNNYLTKIEQQLKGRITILAYIGLAFLLIFTLIIYLANMRPLRRLSESIEKRDFHSFNFHIADYDNLQQNFQEAYGELSKLNEELESTVAKRTASLEHINNLFAEAQALTGLGNWEWNIQENTIHWSNEIYRIFGLRPQEFAATYDAFINTVHIADRDKVRHAVSNALENSEEYSIRHRIVRPDSTVRIVEEHGTVYKDDDGTPIRMVGTIHDITERSKHESELSLQSNVLNAVSDSILVHRTDGTFVYLNEAACQSRGYERDELMAKRVQELDYHDSKISDEVYQENMESIQKQMQEKGEASFEVSHISKQGKVIPLEVRSKLIDEDGEPLVISISRDISDRIEMQRELEKLASTDKLTGTYNRYFFDTVLNKELERVNRYRMALTLIMLDIDHFKEINDNHGHTVGDAVLTKIATIVGNELRKSDIFARWGGEEFMILCPETGLDSGLVLAEKLRQIISATTFDTAGNVTSSFGVTSYQHSESVDMFIKRVDELLYRAKISGRNRVIANTDR